MYSHVKEGMRRYDTSICRFWIRHKGQNKAETSNNERKRWGENESEEHNRGGKIKRWGYEGKRALGLKDRGQWKLHYILLWSIKLPLINIMSHYCKVERKNESTIKWTEIEWTEHKPIIYWIIGNHVRIFLCYFSIFCLLHSVAAKITWQIRFFFPN